MNLCFFILSICYYLEVSHGNPPGKSKSGRHCRRTKNPYGDIVGGSGDDSVQGVGFRQTGEDNFGSSNEIPHSTALGRRKSRRRGNEHHHHGKFPPLSEFEISDPPSHHGVHPNKLTETVDSGPFEQPDPPIGHCSLGRRSSGFSRGGSLRMSLRSRGPPHLPPLPPGGLPDPDGFEDFAHGLRGLNAEIDGETYTMKPGCPHCGRTGGTCICGRPVERPTSWKMSLRNK